MDVVGVHVPLHAAYTPHTSRSLIRMRLRMRGLSVCVLVFTPRACTLYLSNWEWGSQAA